MRPKMKCKICGHRTNDINAMHKHYLKKHPSAMKRSKHKGYLKEHAKIMEKIKEKRGEFIYCPYCGKKIQTITGETDEEAD